VESICSFFATYIINGPATGYMLNPIEVVPPSQRLEANLKLHVPVCRLPVLT
jgi:hypothetical protein